MNISLGCYFQYNSPFQGAVRFEGLIWRVGAKDMPSMFEETKESAEIGDEITVFLNADIFII